MGTPTAPRGAQTHRTILIAALALGAFEFSLAEAQTPAGCDDPAAYCGGVLDPSCLERLGAGALPAGTGCEAQFERYNACLGEIVQRCDAPEPSASAADCDAATAAALWEEAKASNDCLGYDAYLEACPAAPQARIASANAARLGCDAAPERATASDASERTAASAPPLGDGLERGDAPLLWSTRLDAPIGAIATGPHGRLAAAASPDLPAATVWDLETGAAVASIDAQGFEIEALAFSPSGRRLAVARRDGAVRVHDVATGDLIDAWSEQPARLLAVAFRGEDALVAATVFGATFFWDLSSGETKALRQTIVVADRASFSPAGDAVAFISKRGVPMAARLRSLGRAFRAGAAAERATSLALAADGRHALVGDAEGGATLYEIDGGRAVTRLRERDAPVTAIGVDGAMSRALSGDAEGRLQLWDVRRARLLGGRAPSAEGAPIVAIAVSPDGARAVAGSEDGAIKVWDLTGF